MAPPHTHFTDFLVYLPYSNVLAHTGFFLDLTSCILLMHSRGQNVRCCLFFVILLFDFPTHSLTYLRSHPHTLPSTDALIPAGEWQEQGIFAHKDTKQTLSNCQGTPLLIIPKYNWREHISITCKAVTMHWSVWSIEQSLASSQLIQITTIVSVDLIFDAYEVLDHWFDREQSQ